MTDDQNGAPAPRRPMPPSIAPRGTGRPAPDASDAPRRVSTGMPSRGAGATASSPRPQAPRQQQPRQQQAPVQAPPAPQQPAPPRRRKRRHPIRTVLLVLLAAILAFGIWFWLWASAQIQHVDALSGAADTPGRTYLIVGSDSREGWDDNDTLESERTDTIMVLHRPESGPVALISIPRDAYVEIPGHDPNKINASFSLGGAPLLVETVEGVTNLTIDMYLEVGFNGVAEMVDAVGGVELCYDADVDDPLSGMVWEAGCHTVDGDEALSFSRMRYSDPLGDIGRTERQRQVVAAVAEKALTPSTVLNPWKLTDLTSAALDSFTISEGSGLWDLGRAALDLRAGMGGEAVTGTPPIRDMGYSVAGVGSTVLMDPDLEDQFWKDIEEGAFAPGSQVGGLE